MSRRGLPTIRKTIKQIAAHTGRTTGARWATSPRKGPTLSSLCRARVSLDSSPTIDPGGLAPTAAYCNNGTKTMAHRCGRWHIHFSRRMQLHQYMACLDDGRSCAAMGWRHASGSAAATRHGRLRRICEKIGRCLGPGEAAARPTPATCRNLVQSALLIRRFMDHGRSQHGIRRHDPVVDRLKIGT